MLFRSVDKAECVDKARFSLAQRLYLGAGKHNPRCKSLGDGVVVGGTPVFYVDFFTVHVVRLLACVDCSVSYWHVCLWLADKSYRHKQFENIAYHVGGQEDKQPAEQQERWDVSFRNVEVLPAGPHDYEHKQRHELHERQLHRQAVAYQRYQGQYRQIVEYECVYLLVTWIVGRHLPWPTRLK